MHAGEPTPPDVRQRPFSASIYPDYPWQDLSQLIQRQRTTYGHMNDWMRMAMDQSSGGGTGIPTTVTDNNWQQYKTPAQKKEESEVNYRKTYADLTSKIAYRYPNPGAPRLRQGRIGGTWRHIKEVLGHGGGRVCYVDGLIRVYDDVSFNTRLHSASSQRHHLRNAQHSWDAPNNVQLPPLSKSMGQVSFEDPDIDRKIRLSSAQKYKGFYRQN
ncbi:uncharacterized protein LOC117336143 isoform X2 [Pecten maximus]|uniref:uncharacterized protein LOC117336143 isoform X2 n=1 Tax=Pecten maximus TaxID=6579 RepID=UPI0014580749|nr:uncharacterized protein LOC117336143 isoform X2 [Pecten maximus]